MLMRSTVVVTCSAAPQRRQSAHPAPEAVPGVAEQHHRPAVSLPAAGQQRRALLAAAVGVVVQQCSGSRPAAANVLDDFSLSRRKTNARFLAGTVELARERLIAAQALPTEQAIPAVNKAALDCLEIEAPNLRAYSKYREVCTFRIVARSVTDGPAARYTEDSPIAEETVKSLLAVTKGFQVLMATLQSGSDSSAQYAALLAALDRFENAIFSALNVPRDTPVAA